MGDRYSLATSLGELLPHLQGPWPPGLQAHYAPRQEVCPGEPVLLLLSTILSDWTNCIMWNL